MSGSSLSPPDRAHAPVQLPAIKHKLIHLLANNMVAQCPLLTETSYARANGRVLER